LQQPVADTLKKQPTQTKEFSFATTAKRTPIKNLDDLLAFKKSKTTVNMVKLKTATPKKIERATTQTKLMTSEDLEVAEINK